MSEPSSLAEPPIRVYLVEDETMLREQFVSLLCAEPTIDVVGHTGDYETALNEVGRLRPDVVLIDQRLVLVDDGLQLRLGADVQGRAPRGGLDLARDLLRNWNKDQESSALDQPRLILITQYDSDEIIRRCRELGVRGYLHKFRSVHDLVPAIQLVHRGGSYYCREPAVPAWKEVRLTAAEEEVVVLLAQTSWSDEKLAHHLKKGVAAVRTQVRTSMQKANDDITHRRLRMQRVENRTGLVHWYKTFWRIRVSCG